MTATLIGGASVSHTNLAGYTGDTEVADVRIAEAWRGLKAQPEVPGLVTRMAAGLVDRDLVIDVVCAAARRVLTNPESHTEEGNAFDNYSESWKRADSSTDLYFTAAELRRLSGVPAPTAGSFKYS